MTKRNNIIIALCLSLSALIYTFSYFRLSSLESTILTIAKEQNIHVHWMKKHPLKNKLTASIQHKNNTFTLSFSPSIFSSAIHFQCPKSASEFISDNSVSLLDNQLSLHFASLTGTIGNENQLQLLKPVLKSDVGNFSADDAHIKYRMNDQAIMITHANLTNAAQSLLGVSADQLLIDLTPDDASTHALTIDLDHLHLQDKPALNQFCDTSNIPLCNAELIDASLPLSIDVSGTLPYDFMTQNYQDVRTEIQLLAHNDFLSLEQNTKMLQSLDLFSLDLTQETRTIHSEKLRAFTEILQTIYPDMVLPENIEKDNLSFKLHSTPSTLAIDLDHDTKAAQSLSSTLSLVLPESYPYFIKVNDQFIPPLPKDINPETLHLVGEGTLSHDSYLAILEDILETTLTGNQYTVQVYSAL